MTRANDPGPEPWELISERPVYDGWLPVHVRQYRLPDGRECDWEVLKLGDIVSVLPITPEGRVALGWNSATPRRHIAIARGCRPNGAQRLDEFEDCVPVELTVPELRAMLRGNGLMTTVDAAYLALDHAGLL